MNSDTKILIIGSSGQIGTELTQALCLKHGADRVLASDLRKPDSLPCDFTELNAMDETSIRRIVAEHGITDVYLLAAMLSATAEKHRKAAWDLNMESLFIVLEMAREGLIRKIYWPSSIAVFGPTTPADSTPQFTVCEPSTVYGISKFTGERWCEYYHAKFGVDVRSLRYPGLISWTSPPGGGTTDYAVDIFHEALKNGRFTCFLREDTSLPMMYMDDAIRATLELMEAPAEQVKIRSSYNVSAFSFTPAELALKIKSRIPEFSIEYAPDFRQAIADSWPNSIDDSRARSDWGWKPAFDLDAMCDVMLKNLAELYKKETV